MRDLLLLFPRNACVTGFLCRTRIEHYPAYHRTQTSPWTSLLSDTEQVARYTALVFGITYGIFHQSTMQTRYDEKKVSRGERRGWSRGKEERGFRV